MDHREIDPFDTEPVLPFAFAPMTPAEEAALAAAEAAECGLCQDASPGQPPHPHTPPTERCDGCGRVVPAAEIAVVGRGWVNCATCAEMPATPPPYCLDPERCGQNDPISAQYGFTHIAYCQSCEAAHALEARGAPLMAGAAEDIRFDVDAAVFASARALGLDLGREAHRKFGVDGPRPTFLYNPAQRNRLRAAATALRTAETAEAVDDACGLAVPAIEGLGVRGLRTYEAPREALARTVRVKARLERELRAERALEDARVARGLCGLCERPRAEYPSLEPSGDRLCYFCAEEVRCMVAEARAEFAEQEA